MFNLAELWKINMNYWIKCVRMRDCKFWSYWQCMRIVMKSMTMTILWIQPFLWLTGDGIFQRVLGALQWTSRHWTTYGADWTRGGQNTKTCQHQKSPRCKGMKQDSKANDCCQLLYSNVLLSLHWNLWSVSFVSQLYLTLVVLILGICNCHQIAHLICTTIHEVL